ncbi:hypothetical protein [Mastigocoleus sp. MO_188.B34]|uniref:hypothetical protein n=1 Tax=Mastigocoleus sp. MO_188.B34 TaxID=3036635 RepID=UPI00261C6BF1|nr:hypothetical protein [Mastigocoleus sp. MO_188.B34]MDJ0697227.1 hypothetical protein [Mastigocoleus sp. MO_188.B34]
MSVRIKELIIKYEDDGAESPLTAEEHKQKYRPLNLVVHHHCSPPPPEGYVSPDDKVAGDEPKTISIDLNELNKEQG